MSELAAFPLEQLVPAIVIGTHDGDRGRRIAL